uniref:Uncharacterized protein n=1 Tax=Rhizophora mucronata TaxID=61149 RepID=A0A2P2NJI6_RHIMU
MGNENQESCIDTQRQSSVTVLFSIKLLVFTCIMDQAYNKIWKSIDLERRKRGKK